VKRPRNDALKQKEQVELTEKKLANVVERHIKNEGGHAFKQSHLVISRRAPTN
jgi:hypothetical protein